MSCCSTIRRGPQPRRVVARRHELRTGKHEVTLARAFLGQPQAVAEFEFGLEEVGLQPVHGLRVQPVLAQRLRGRADHDHLGPR